MGSPTAQFMCDVPPPAAPAPGALVIPEPAEYGARGRLAALVFAAAGSTFRVMDLGVQVVECATVDGLRWISCSTAHSSASAYCEVSYCASREAADEGKVDGPGPGTALPDAGPDAEGAAVGGGSKA